MVRRPPPHPHQYPSLLTGGFLQKAHGILSNTFLTDFKVQAISGRASGTSHLGNLLTAPHHLTDLYQQFGSMPVAGDNIIAVINLHHITILGMVTRIGDHTASRSINRRSGIRHKVHSFVHGVGAGERIYTPTKIRGIKALDETNGTGADRKSTRL